MRYIFETDYSSDFLKWYKICEELKISISNTNTNNSFSKLESLQSKIIKEQNSALAFFFALQFEHKRYLMQQIILDNKDYKYAYIFAQNISGADIKALQKIVIDSKKVKYICKFGCFVKGADSKSLEKWIIESKNAKLTHMWIKYVKGIKVNKFKNIIINSKRPRYLFALAKLLTKKSDILQVEDLIIKSKCFTYIRLFAEKIKLANIEKLEKAIIASQDIEEMKKFAKKVKKSSTIKKLLLII